MELKDGRIFKANHEVIVSCGTLRTPQVLLLSGIGPKSELQKHSISQVLDLPVGQNLHDHVACTQYWKLKDPSKGYAVGSPNFNNPAYQEGLPCDWILTESIPNDKMKKALEADGQNVSSDHPYLKARGHFESLLVYAPANLPMTGMGNKIPFDGSYIASATLMLLPTSRGTVTLANTDASADPLIDP